jgi:hypothetical protein
MKGVLYMIFKLVRANSENSFRTEDGTLLVPCLFISLEDDSWHSHYMRESDIALNEEYISVYKPSKGGLYKITFKRKEN